MVAIFGNTQVTLKKAGVYSLKGKRRRSLLEKALKGKGFIKEKKERQGPKGKIAFLLPLPRDQNKGGGGVMAAPVPGEPGLGGGHGGGKGTRGSRAFDSPSYLGQG